MTEQYTPTTEEVRELIAEAREQAAYLRGVSRDGSMPYSGELLKFLADALEAMHAEHDAALACIAEAAAKAWDEGRAAEKLAWEHAFDGHPVPEGEMCGECVVENPYRKAVKS